MQHACTALFGILAVPVFVASGAHTNVMNGTVKYSLFVLDTGAGVNVLSQSVAETLNCLHS
jgi:hypothetical protein